MKELKKVNRFRFRVWDKKAQVMEYNDLGAYCNVEVGMTLCYEDCVLMQCTGLSDRDGNGIYEGDVCEKDGTLYEITWITRLAKFCATCIKSEYVLVRNMNFPLQSYVLEGTLDTELKIIGNKYKNPELLTA
jgi:uncharacterized phage protein (TIGR01671 family)